MAGDYIVPSKSNKELRTLADRCRGAFGVSAERYVDIIKCLTSGWIETLDGRKRLIIEILPDTALYDDDAVTTIKESRVTIQIKKSVWQAASDLASHWRHYRARFTLAHELGH